ncbi:hypothetical protein THRCLA_06734 [Thraustotheca clavata]|uniref:Uncharacterized protein n=1 Tax=Thraustotheca clavata TaxID=74557 RepID=A0A1V9ZK79_9STRA|nr:hypothetical protein THRCLA_06734 [Thraustotheca clavata]
MIKARRHRPREIVLDAEDIPLTSSFPKASKSSLKQRVEANEQRLRSDRMRLAELVSSDSQERQHRSTSSTRSRPSSPSHMQQLMGQKAIHKWNPESKRTQVPNEATPLDIGLSSSDYGDGDILADVNQAKRRLTALTRELDLGHTDDDALDYDTKAPASMSSQGSPPRPRVYSDLQHKMDDMQKHLQRLQEEKQQLERNQLDAERNVVDMSSSLRLLSDQVSQFLHPNINNLTQSRDMQTDSQFQDDLMDELKKQRQLLGDLEQEMSQWRHDADMLEQGRVLEQSEQKSQLIQFGTTSKLLEERTEEHKEQIRRLHEDIKPLRENLDAATERLSTLEAKISAQDNILNNTQKWSPSLVTAYMCICGLILMFMMPHKTILALWFCAVLGYDCTTVLS